MGAAFSGELPTVIIRNEDRPGIVSEVSRALSRRGANIATMQLYRTGGAALRLWSWSAMIRCRTACGKS